MLQIVIWKKKSSELSEAIEAEVVPSNYGGKEKPIEELQGKVYRSRQFLIVEIS